MSISDLPARVEGKDRLRNDSLVIQVVKDRDGPIGGKAGVGQAQDAIIRYLFQDPTGLILAQAKNLVHDDKVPDLWERRVFPYNVLGNGAGTGLGRKYH